MIRILIADDHVLIREGFKKLISREADMQVAGEAGNSAEVHEFLRKGECDIIVLDISMPGKSGLDLLKELENNFPRIKVLILSMHPEERFAVRSIKSSASGYLSKTSASDELITAIRRIAGGGRYISESLAENLAKNLSASAKNKPHERLSAREFQVFRLLAKGRLTKQIADELSLSVSTVNTYRRRIFLKLSISSTAELIHYAIKNELVD